MTNREQVAWAFGADVYNADDISDMIDDMMGAAGVGCLTSNERDRLAAWLDLECDPETNNWGTFPEIDEEGEVE